MIGGVRWRSVLLLFLVVVVIPPPAIAQPKNVQVSVRAKWPGTPILLEATELLSKEWKGLYWEFLELWVDPGKGSDCSNARCCVQKIVDDGRSFLSERMGQLFEFALILRSAAPKLVLYRQLAEESLSSFPLDDGEVEEEPLDGKRVDSSLIKKILNVPGGSCCWVDAGSMLLFNVSQLLSWLETSTQVSFASTEQPELFDFDHVYGDASTTSHVAILYGAPGTECFRDLHRVMVDASKKGTVKYIVRPMLSSSCLNSTSYCSALGAFDSVNLGGYGVELALKNMEYKAMDDSTVKKGLTLEDPRTEDLSQEVRGFIFSKILERKPELANEVMIFRDHLLSSTLSDTLEVWELKDLGHQTAQRILQASDPLQSMQEINQNFPSVVSLLSRMKLNDSIKDEIISNQRMVPPGKSLMALNGALINIEDLDLYQLVDLTHGELTLADQFSELKLPQNAIQKILSAPPPAESNSFRLDFRSSHVVYLNNLEEDAMYRRWRSNIHEILMPVFPGQLRYIRKNIFHAVYILDPATSCGAEAIETILSMHQNNVPMRFGVVLYSSKLIKTIEENGGELPTSALQDTYDKADDVSSLIIQLFLYVKENYNNQMAFQFLSNVNTLWTAAEDSDEEAVEVHHVERAFVETLLPRAKSHPQEVLLKLQKESNFKDLAVQSTTFVHKLGLAGLGCSLLMNGLVYESNEDAAMNAMNEELPKIQEQVYFGHIDGRTDVLEKFLSESGYRRYNPHITSGGNSKKRFVSLVKLFLQKDSLLHDLKYLHSPGSIDDVKPVTHILSVDVSSRKGFKLLQEGIRYMMKESERARMGLIVYVNAEASSPSLLLTKAIELTVSSFSYKVKVLDFLDKLCLLYENQYISVSMLDSVSVNSFVSKVCDLATEYNLPSDEYKATLSEISVEFLKQQMEKVAHFLASELGLELGGNAIITNGRIIIPSDGKPFVSDDFRLLESVEYEQRVKYMFEIVEGVEWKDVNPDSLTSKFYSDLIMLVSSSMSTRERSSERAHFEILNAKYSAVVLNNGNSSIHIDAVIDPLSPSSQKLSALLKMLWKYVQPSMRIVLNPVSSLSDLPLKNYYRYVLPSLDEFSKTDYSIGGPRAFFSNMPLSKTLTMNLDVPEPWLVEPVVAIHDLDNILLENLGDVRTLQAVFELESLLLTGHCSEKDHDPPRGLQLILGTKRMPHIVDTLVMSNLGYWQMKVFPGVWYLQLAPGKSAEIYALKENDGGSQIYPSSKRIVINDLRGKLVHLEVEKRKGKEHEELLDAVDDSHSSDKKKNNQNAWNANILRWASGFIGGSGLSRKPHDTVEQKSGRHGKPINIFSIASGHLYERFLKIMILSVLKNTQRPVKFWFIKNYLSPQFKDVIPHMAQEYGFEYELITYKWPTWLHKQKEKQRIIWAYKILFLDVIFPLSLEKVIFVDADQVVRTDMGELYDMDLKGRPLAYTPFCDNNKDMDGYRFWRQGFWKDHLRGKPYHISALYVVDLVKFRQTAAGDTLRIYYENLSKDPNSLSNLDQDLPNYAQHTVPIFSLPQEWLWCESWCGNATKSNAKTIDLCNNPMTKEPKLQGARRIIPEWADLDAEARQVTARIQGEETEAQAAVRPSVPHINSKSRDSEGEDLESLSEL